MEEDEHVPIPDACPWPERLRRWLLRPALDQLTELKEYLMATFDTLQAAVDRNGSAVRDAVVALADQRTKIAALQAAVDSGSVDQTQLAALTASLDASSDAVAQALAPVVADPDTNTGDVPAPPAENPGTSDPTSVDGSVPAGEPLPES